MIVHNYFVAYKGFDKKGNEKLTGSTTFSAVKQMFGNADFKAHIISECIDKNDKKLNIIPVCISYLGVSEEE